jgi:glucoamylase
LNRSERILPRCNMVGQAIVMAVLAAFVAPNPVESQTAGGASDGPGNPAAWTTGNKLAVGTSADTTSKVWFTVAKGVTTEVFYPRLDIPNMQDMQYIVTDGSTFTDLERDKTSHAVSMPDEKALE